jgi:C-terminal processing protease CtpA/Prc
MLAGKDWKDFQSCLITGDEIIAVNGKSLQGMTHDEAINEFRAIKYGPVILRVSRNPAFSLDSETVVIVKE